MTDKVKVSQTAMQQRAEHQKRLREQARKNRSAKGIPVDQGVTFADLPQEYREDYFYNLEQEHKRRNSATKGGRRREGFIPTFDTTERGDPIPVSAKR